MEKKVVSVLIPTYNAGTEIIETLSRLYDQELDPNFEMEIIIVDSSSTDNTVSLIRTKYPNITLNVIENKDFDHGGTRNYLMSISKGDYLLYMTQDAIPYDKRMVKNLLTAFSDPDVFISFARQIPKKDANPLEIFARNFNYPSKSIEKNLNSIETLGIKTFFNSNVCSMYRRETFLIYGGFPEKVILNEDMILASKVIFGGKKVIYNAESKVLHSHNYRIKQVFKRYFDIGMAFNETSDLFKDVSNEKEGFKMIINQTKFLIKTNNLKMIPYSFCEVIFKYLGYRLGKAHKIFPDSLKRNMSAYMK
ncbi:glycosyltransferase family 2 protein [Bacillus salipaludis]|uniref:Glycosyltransferase family 2 protein n=1 Tax=Bacillus salipaludis TaxID=2547811 RepID=A0A4R5VXP0_9BACI|nr:glycosyltransferase [Bacillus salipaludis]TDK64130.1 glycosyltransferase family 2 protein [Bacillus salipaludis]